ncbi:MAG: multi-sensor signal transduction histidine kinase [Thermoleophilia bacterium]|nr:multi-sensor signal transduction histidine kinase [Thermoleophilia bacterium]
MTGKVRTYVGIVVALAASLLAVGLVQLGVPTTHDAITIGGFAVAFVLVQLLPVPFPRGAQLELVRVEEAVVVPLVLLVEPSVALVAVAIGVVAGQLAGTRAEPIKAVFNASQLVIAVTAALLTTRLVAGEFSPGYSTTALLAAGVGLVAMFIVNQLLVAGVMRVAAGTPMPRVLVEDAGLKVGMWVANAALGSLLVLPAAEAPELLFVALVPLVMLHAAWRVHADRARDEQRLRELGVAVGGLATELSLERVARSLAESAREVLDSIGAEVRLFDADRTFWARRGPGGVEHGEHRLGTGGDSHDAGRMSFNVPLQGSQGTFGELSVWNERAADSSPRPFSRRDRTLLEMLGHQASSALDNSLLAARAAVQQRTIAQVFDHSSEGMLVLDRRGRVRGWNPAMQAISGFTTSTVDASPISLLSPQLASIVDATEAGTLDAVVSTADGERRHVRASFAPIERAEGDTPEDEEHAWVVVVRDTTLEQETERLRDDFVATVSHELRTPLTAIKGFLETMRRDDIELGAAQVRMFLQIMGEQADRLERLISDLLDMSAIESGRPLEVDLAPVDLSSTVQRAIATFTAAKPHAQVTFEEPDLSIVVAADGPRLEQVVTNLMDNALKHGGLDQPISVTVRGAGPGLGEVSVSDNGPGISAVDQRRIFERFFVAADSVTRTGGGAGLGLYICRRIVSAMSGRIDVRSQVGEGSTFTVAIPMLASTIDGSSKPEAQMLEAH